MKTSIASVCLSGDLREKLAAISAEGFDGVEIFEADFLTHDGISRVCLSRSGRSPSSGQTASST